MALGPVAAGLLLGLGVCAASYLKSDWTENDFERFEDLRLTFLFFALLGGACLGYVWLWRERPALSATTVVVVATIALATLLPSFPVGSKDVFLYAFFGKVWGTYHSNPYTVPPAAFALDAWQPYVQVLWAKQPAPYGPLFLWQARLVDAIAAGDLLAAVALHKVIALAALAATILIGAHAIAPAQRGYQAALLAWNPLLLFESIGNGHNDAVMVLLLMIASGLHARGGSRRGLGVPAALALAVWYKWYALLFVPAFAVGAWREGDQAPLRRWAVVMLVALLVSGVVLLAPLADAIPVVARRLLSHENLREVFPLQLSPLLAMLSWALAHAGFAGPATLQWFDAIRLGAFALVVVVTLALQWRGALGVMESVCALSTGFTMLAVTVLWPWHLELPVAFGLVSPSPMWRGLAVLLTLLGVLSYFFTFTWAAALLLILGAAVRFLRRIR
jgi:hypothetical protein